VASVDDDTYSRLFDQVADAYDVNITYCAGNSGPGANTLWSPGTSYNGIDVANMYDMNTTNRADDVIFPSSSRGPTVGNRKKPDIAAPGTSISSPSINWATGSMWSNWTGTSMAAPHVAGGALLLQQSGVVSSLARKAILLNSTDQITWAADLGWGYGNLTRAFAQRQAYTLGTVAAAGQPGAVRFYRVAPNGNPLTATLVWNRHTTLNDLDLLAYYAGTNALAAAAASTIDNVEKVAVSAGVDVALKVRSNSAVLSGGISGEPFALAVSAAGVTAANGPALQLAVNPATVLPGASFTATATVTNNGDLAAFNIDVSLTLPTGFMIAGSATQRVAQLAPGASQSLNWTATAPPATGSFSITASASSKSYEETFSGQASAAWTVSTTAAVTPQTGWWWDSNLSGMGFFVEYGGKSGTGMFVGGYVYDANESATWLVSTGAMSGATYTSNWLRVSGGQTLLGAYKAPTSTTPAGNLSMTFSDSTHAVMTRPDGTQISLVRFSFSGATPTPPVAGAPQSGWWWGGSSLSGTGYGIEIQGSSVFIVAYMYDDAGNPVWYLATGNLTTPTSYTGTWDVYAGGPQLTSPEGSYGTHKVSSASPMSLTFSDATHGTLTMGSVSVPIQRFQEF
jgi:hypothetical protein